MKAKLPVFATVHRSFNAVFSTRFLLSVCFIKCFLAYFVVNQLAFVVNELSGFIYGLAETSERLIIISIGIGILSFQTIATLSTYFILAPFLISIHRLIIMGDDLPSKPFKNFFCRRNINFVVYWFLLSSPILIFYVISQLGGKFGFPEWINLFGLLSIPYLVIFLRVIIYLPFIAIDYRQTLSRCWKITRGSTWRFFGAFVITVGIILLIRKYVVVPLDELRRNLPPGEIYSSLRMVVGSFSIGLINNFISFVFASWGVAIVSHAFNFFKEERGFDILEEKG